MVHNLPSTHLKGLVQANRPPFFKVGEELRQAVLGAFRPTTSSMVLNGVIKDPVFASTTLSFTARTTLWPR